MTKSSAKTDNRTNGNRFEQELSHILAENGFWVHVMQQNKAGQPADIIAVKGKFHTLIDCKVISDDRGFPLQRIEENQRHAMAAFCRKAKENCWFAMKLPDESIWMMSFSMLMFAEKHEKKRIPEEEIRDRWPLDEWLKAAELWAEES